MPELGEVSKSSWQILGILSRSEAAINFHVANIVRKFDVQTRQQAVIKAIMLCIGDRYAFELTVEFDCMIGEKKAPYPTRGLLR